MKTGDKVIFIGASLEQTRWGGNDDPYKVMKEGDSLEIQEVEVHSWHTKLIFVGIKGKYNTVCFKPKPNYINNDIKKVSETDLKKALHELKMKHEEERRQAQIDLNNAFRDGFRCM
jgi:hypothetical protein